MRSRPRSSRTGPSARSTSSTRRSRPRGARRAVGGVPGGARPLLLPRRELPDDRRRARDPLGHDREPDLALPREAARALRRCRAPVGTVTFLFTDIEGSTRLLHELGERIRRGARPRTGASLREAFAAHGGVEVDTQGDAFFFAFADAREAVAAARGRAGRARRRARCACGWACTPATPSRTDEGYFGADVHLGARVAASRPRRPGRAHEGDPRPARRRGRARPRRAPRQGLRRAGLDLPARRRALPAAEDDLEHEPPPPRVELRRPGARGRGGGALRPRGAARHAHRPGRLGEDAALDRGGLRARRRVPRTASSGSASRPSTTRRSCCRRSRRRSARRATSPATSASASCCSCSTTSSRSSRPRPSWPRSLEACPNLQLLVTSRELLRVRGEVEYEVLRSPIRRRSSSSASRSGSSRARRSRSSAAASTTCRSRSSSPPPARRRSRRSRSSSGSASGSTCSRAAATPTTRQQTLRATIEW